MFIPVEEWFGAFLLTLAVEVPLLVVMLRRTQCGRLRLAALAVFANLGTHPAVWFVFTQLFLAGTVEYVVASELWAVAVEAVFYAVAVSATGWRRALAASVVTNAASFLAGHIALAVLAGP